MSKSLCPSCGEQGVPYIGKSNILIIGEHPGPAEMETGRPFSIHPKFTTAGYVLRKELARCGVDLAKFRIGNLWLHEPNENDNCFKAGYDLVLDEAKGKDAILLVGSDVVSTFTSYKVSDVGGLQVDSSVLSCPNIMAMVNPAIVLHGRGLGEVRLAIKKFVSMLERENLL